MCRVTVVSPLGSDKAKQNWNIRHSPFHPVRDGSAELSERQKRTGSKRGALQKVVLSQRQQTSRNTSLRLSTCVRSSKTTTPRSGAGHLASPVGSLKLKPAASFCLAPRCKTTPTPPFHSNPNVMRSSPAEAKLGAFHLIRSAGSGSNPMITLRSKSTVARVAGSNPSRNFCTERTLSPRSSKPPSRK